MHQKRQNEEEKKTWILCQNMHTRQKTAKSTILKFIFAQTILFSGTHSLGIILAMQFTCPEITLAKFFFSSSFSCSYFRPFLYIYA